MKVSLLEFKVKDNIFGIRTEFIRNVFDIEFVKPILSLPDYTAGITKYNNNVFLLICLENLLGLSNEKCENPIGKFAITIKAEDNHYSLIVDDIIKIQEVEKHNNNHETIEFYNIHGEVIEEITPQFIKNKVKIPSFQAKSIQKIDNTSVKKEEENFLVFILNNKKFAINTDFIDRIEHLESLKDGVKIKDNSWIEKTFLVKNEVIKAGNLKRLLKFDNENHGETLVILGNNHKNFGLLTDDILDILSIKTSQLEKNLDDNDIFDKFFIYEKEVVPVLSQNFIKDIIDKHSIEHSKTADNELSTNISNKIDYLVIDILGEKFAIKMEDVEEVLDYDNLNISPHITDNPYIKGILVLKDEAKSTFLVSFEKLFNKTFDKNMEKSVIVVNQDGVEVAVLVSKIEKIEQVSEENVFSLEDNKQLIKGSILSKDDEIINILNISYIKEKTREG